MKYQIKRLNRNNENQVNELRKKAYLTTTGMAVKDAGIFWNKSDDQSLVLGVFQGDRLVSTMRGEIITSLPLIEEKLECPWVYGDLALPAMILSKAAIDKSFLGSGFNSILRLIFFRAAKEWDIKTVLGTMTADSIRIKSMEDLGYRFFSNDLGWSSENYRSLKKVVISKLNFGECGEDALAILSRKYEKLMCENFEVNLEPFTYNEVKVVS